MMSGSATRMLRLRGAKGITIRLTSVSLRFRGVAGRPQTTFIAVRTAITATPLLMCSVVLRMSV